MSDGWYWYEKTGGIPLRKLDANGNPTKELVHKDEIEEDLEILAASYVGWYKAKVMKDKFGEYYAMSEDGMLFSLELDEDDLWGTRCSVNAKAVQIGKPDNG